jgi:hypothetical protein
MSIFTREILGDAKENKGIPEFTIFCNKCGQADTEVKLDFAAFPETAWCKLRLHCNQCSNFAELFDTDG